MRKLKWLTLLFIVSLVILVFIGPGLILSAAIVGLLVFGRPAYLFFNGLKRESVKQALYTIGFLFVETVIILTALAGIAK